MSHEDATRTRLRTDPLAAALSRYIAGGDEAAMAEIVRETRARLLSAARRVGDPQDAEDAVQAAYLSLVRHRGGTLVVPVFPWLLTATLRIAYRNKALGRREERLASLLSREARWDRGPLADAMASEDAALLRRDVDRLPARYRDVVVLHYLQGLSTAEAALLLETSDATVRKRLERARTLLRDGRLRRLAILGVVMWETLASLGSERSGPAARAAFLGGAMKTSTAVVGFLVASALGAAIGAFASRGDADDARGTDPLRREIAELRAQIVERDTRLRASEERAARPPRPRAEAASAIPEVPVAPVAAKEEAPVAAPPAAVPDLRIPGADYDEALRRIDWTGLGKHVYGMMATLRDVSRALERGAEPDRSADIVLKEHEAGVEKELLKILGDVPGADGPGIFTNPGFLGNAVAAALDAGNLPLAEDQRTALIALQRRFAEDDRLRLRGYDEQTFALRKLVDEADLKQRFFASAFDVLTPEQRDLVHPPALRDRLDGDMISTAVLWKNHARELRYADAQQFAGSATDDLVRFAELPEEKREPLRAAVERWTSNLPPSWFGGTPDVVETRGKTRISVTSELAHRELELLESLAATLSLDSAAASRVRDVGTVWRLVPTKKR